MTIRKRIATLQTKQFVLAVDSKELRLIRTIPVLNSRLSSGDHVFKDNYNFGHGARGKILFNFQFDKTVRVASL